MKEEADYLNKAANYLSNPRHWVKSRFRERRLLVGDAYCARGYLIYHATKAMDRAELFLIKAGEIIGKENEIFDGMPDRYWPMAVNDKLGHKETVRMFRLAAKMAEAEGKMP